MAHQQIVPVVAISKRLFFQPPFDQVIAQYVGLGALLLKTYIMDTCYEIAALDDNTFNMNVQHPQFPAGWLLFRVNFHLAVNQQPFAIMARRALSVRSY